MTCDEVRAITAAKSVFDATRAEFLAVRDHFLGCVECCRWAVSIVGAAPMLKPEEIAAVRALAADHMAPEV